MRPGGYIGSGVASGLLGVVVIAVARADDDLESAIADAQYALGETPEASGDGLWYLIAFALFALAGVLILIGAIGAGIRAGRSD